MFILNFRNGLADVIGLDWLRMFSSRELSILISGSEQDIGMDDLMVRSYKNWLGKKHHNNGKKKNQVYLFV